MSKLNRYLEMIGKDEYKKLASQGHSNLKGVERQKSTKIELPKWLLEYLSKDSESLSMAWEQDEILTANETENPIKTILNIYNERGRVRTIDKDPLPKNNIRIVITKNMKIGYCDANDFIHEDIVVYLMLLGYIPKIEECLRCNWCEKYSYIDEFMCFEFHNGKLMTSESYSMKVENFIKNALNKNIENKNATELQVIKYTDYVKEKLFGDEGKNTSIVI